MEETKVCKVCGRELPLTKFPLSKSGTRKETCNEYIASKSAETRRSHRIRGGQSPLPFPTHTSTVCIPAKYGGRCVAPRNGLKAVGL